MFKNRTIRRIKRVICGLSCGILFILIINSCEILDKEPLTAVPEEDMWNNEVLTTAFLNDIYYYVMPRFSATATSSYCDETIGAFVSKTNKFRGANDFMYGRLEVSQEIEADLYRDINSQVLSTKEKSLGIPLFNRDTYGYIRKINMFLSYIDEGTLNYATKQKLKGQAYFLRAWIYNKLVILYGGVPMVLDIQTAFSAGNIDEELFVTRNSTRECIELIATDLDSAFANLPATWDDRDDYGRITRGAAISLKGRLLLYWASPQFNPDNKIERWQWAYDVNKKALEVLDEDGYGLDPSFENLLDNCVENSKEAIMVTVYSESLSGFSHSYDNNVRPAPQTKSGKNPDNCPSWNLVLAFPMSDGYPIYASGGSVPFDTIMYWQNRDPRFKYTVAYNSENYPLSGQTDYKLWTYFYLDENNNWLNALENKASNVSPTGFYCKKFINPKIAKDNTDQIGTDWIEIRYAEVLLNFAECANELDGKQDEVFSALDEIRNGRDDVKAGMGYINDNKNDRVIMREIIMTERQVELAFENKRHWDLRRRNMFVEDLGPNIKKLNGTYRLGWRIELNQDRFTAEYAELARADNTIWDLSKPNVYKVVFSENYADILDTESPIKFLQPQYNFYPIPSENTEKNPNLEQTIYWGGSYDPFNE